MKTKEQKANYQKQWLEDNREEQKSYKKQWYHANVNERHLENKTRMTIQGQRYRVGNSHHPYNLIYKTRGIEGVYEAMGLIESTVSIIKKSVIALYDKHIHGEVYIIANPAWGGWVKVGMAIDAKDRLKSYQTSSPFRDYTLHYSYPTDDRRKSEAEAHSKLEQKYERRNEWFFCTANQAKEVLNEHKE
jgi:hypothetical protein